MTERWVRSNYKAYNETGAMYEKVSVSWSWHLVVSGLLQNFSLHMYLSI
jgi:hypothetical protein